MTELTGYDTGRVLEPKPWGRALEPDNLGKVDFENDESATSLIIRCTQNEDQSVTDVEIELGVASAVRVVIDGKIMGMITDSGRVIPAGGW